MNELYENSPFLDITAEKKSREIKSLSLNEVQVYTPFRNFDKEIINEAEEFDMSEAIQENDVKSGNKEIIKNNNRIHPNPDNIKCEVPGITDSEINMFGELSDSEIFPYIPFKDQDIAADNSSSAEVPEDETSETSSSANTCEGLYCWAKTVLNNQLGINLPVNNFLDEPAGNAIGEFQVKYNLEQTKKIDPATERKMLECDAIQKKKGTADESEAVNIINSAKTKIEDWTKKAVADKKEITNSYRDPRKLWAFVLHHMAFKRRNRAGQLSDPESYLKTGAHFCIMMDGRIIQLHQFSRMIWHGNCLSPRSVAVEFEGNFPNIKGRWWIDKSSSVQNKDIPTQVQFDSGKFLARYLKTVLGTTSIFAHRQSSEGRENDPGPDIWYNVGQWAVDNLGMTDGGIAFKCGTGNPILPVWRTWGNKTSLLLKKESEQNDIETMERDDESIDEGAGFYEEASKPEYENETEYPETLEINNEPEYHHYSDELNEYETELSKAAKLNRYYADKLGWNKFYDQINDLLLPYSGLQNVSLGEETFAKAVAAWQSSQGFSAKDCDGIIGPDTWEVMKRILLGHPGNSSVKDTLLNVSAAGAVNSLEIPPDVYSSEKVPEGFNQSSYSGWHGLDRKSKIRVDEAAKELNAKGILKNSGITEVDIDTFQRLSNAETGGRIQNFYSLDMAIVSIGFRQFTFIHGNIHDWINKAPAAFKRYGIEIDDSLPPYIIKRSRGNYTVKRIKGVDDPETLRWNGWAQRFYFAGLDYDIVAAEFLLAKEYFSKELGRLKTYLKNNPEQFKTFTGFYGQSGHLRAFFHELNNAAPSRVPGITSKALQKVSPNEDTNQFFQIFFKTAKEVWPKPDQVQRIFNNTGEGSKIKIFEDEFTYNDSNISDELDSAKTEQFPPVYELFSNEPELLIQDLSRSVRLNQYYSEKLGWSQYYDQINNLLLPFSGQQNVSLGEEAFAQAVSVWQRQQGFPEKDCDGIIGPNTWGRMKPFINSDLSLNKPADSAVSSALPSIESISAFNAWYAQKIVDSMNTGITGSYFNAKDQLESIAKGESVLNVDPNKRIIQILPVIYHIVENAKSENYRDIIIGSFIRKADDNGSCTGHCEGRCIDLNFKRGNFEDPDSTKMVIKILQYLNTLPSQFKKNLGFGMPLQGDFFGHQNFKKFRSVDSSNLINPELRNLVFRLGIVFPDNNNHLHIQVRWDTVTKINHEDLAAGLHDENETVQYGQQENLFNNLFDNYTLAYRLDKVRDWLPLLLFKVDDDIVEKLKSRNMYVQYAHNESYSNELNTDFYRLRIHKYPVMNGVLLNAQSLIKYIRLNINNLVDTDLCDFSPYDNSVDTPVWQSDNPKGAVLKLDIKGPDNASVVVSLAKPNGWRFTTVHTPATGAHPVSGNREFFIAKDSATGGTYFVIKGLDMMSTGIAGLGLPLFGGWGFKQGDTLWKSMRSKIIHFINSNGGAAGEDITYSERVEWRFVYYRYKNLLESIFGKGAGGPDNSPFFDVSEVPEREINSYWKLSKSSD